MTLSLDTHNTLGSSNVGSPLSPGSVGAPRSAASSSGAHARLHKHRRRPSNASTGSNNSPAITQFPVFDPTIEDAPEYTNPMVQDSMPVTKRTWSDGSVGTYHSSAFSKKIKPLSAYGAAKDKRSLNLNLSKAENEQRGAYITDSNPTGGESSYSNQYPGPRAHSRTISSTSQISSTSAHSAHRGAAYIHPARQQPHCPTPPVLSPGFEPPSALRPASSNSDLANIPSLPPSSHYRASNIAALRTQTSTPTGPGTPALNSSAPATARSSFDSAFRDRVSFTGTRRSRRPSRNKAEPMDFDEQQAEIAKKRAAFEAKENRLNQKYRLEDERRQRDEEKKVRRKAEAAEQAKSKRTRTRTRGDSAGTVETIATMDSNNTGYGGIAPINKAFSARSAPLGPSRRGSAEQLGAIGYASTAELGRPKIGSRLNTDDGEIHEEKIPRRQKKPGVSSVGKAAQSRWIFFWFQVKTTLLKMCGGGRKT